MNIVFADSKSKFFDLSEEGWLYFFLTHPQPNDMQAFIKFGVTERTIKDRLNNYGSLDMANIYGVKTLCNQVYLREGAMIQIFNQCKDRSDVDIWGHTGNEFLKGNLDMMLKIFLYFATIDISKAVLYKTKQQIVKSDKLTNWIESLPSIETYNINYLSSKKIHKMNPEIQNILTIDIKETSEPKQVISFDRSLIESISEQVQKQNLSKEKAYDKIINLLLGTTCDLFTVSKLWKETFLSLSRKEIQQDPFSSLEKIKMVLSKLISVLHQYKTSVRIGNSIKEQFLTIWTQVLKELETHNVTEQLQEWISENVTKPILRIRDIRWILKDLEGYIIRSHLFQFKRFKIIPSFNEMSRDNCYILKKYIDDEEDFERGNDTKWTICEACRYGKIESLQAAFERGAPFNIRDQPSNQTDELWVALKYNNLDCVKFLLQYDKEKEERSIIFFEDHANYLRKLKHINLIKALMPKFLTEDEKKEISSTSNSLTLDNKEPDQFTEFCIN